MINFIHATIIIASIAAFILTLAMKWGVVEYVQVHGNAFFSKMFHCNFCLSWWMSVIVSLIWFLISGDFYVLFVPFTSTMIARFML